MRGLLIFCAVLLAAGMTGRGSMAQRPAEVPHIGVLAPLSPEVIRRPFSPSADNASQRLLQGERLVHISDIAAAGLTNPRARASVEAGFRTLLMVPLRKDDELLGYITALRRVARAFTDKEIALLPSRCAKLRPR